MLSLCDENEGDDPVDEIVVAVDFGSDADVGSAMSHSCQVASRIPRLEFKMAAEMFVQFWNAYGSSVRNAQCRIHGNCYERFSSV